MKSDENNVLDSCSALADFFNSSDEDIIQLQTDYHPDMSSLGSEKYSSSVVRSCVNFENISSDINAGGIAGESCDISVCRSYSYDKTEKEFSGSTAGNANGTVAGCVFVENGVGGADGISCLGSAEPISHREMMQLSGISEWFKKLPVTFIV